MPKIVIHDATSVGVYPVFGVQQIIDLAAQEGFAPVDEQPPAERPHIAQAECRFVHIAVEGEWRIGVRFRDALGPDRLHCP